MFHKDSKRLKNIELAIRHLQCCCSSAGDGGIQSIAAGDNISIDDTDPSNPIISVSGIDVPEQYFVEITEGGRTGYGLKYRKDNPDNYGNIGVGSIDFTIQTSSSSSNGVTGDYTLAIGGDGRQAPWGYSIVSHAVTTASRHNGYYNLIIGGSGTVHHNNIWSSLLLGQNNVIGIEGASISTSAVFGTTVNSIGSNIRAGSGSAYFGAGLIGGSSSTLVVGTSNEDLTINQGGNNPNRFNVPNPRFIVGNGTYNPSNNTVGTRSNAFYVMSSGEIGMPSYGDGTFTGTATKLLAVDADGKVIEEDLPSGTSLTVTDDNEVSVSGVETINFTNATVTDNENGSVDVTVPVGITVVDDDNTETYNNTEALIFEGVTIIDNEDGSVTIPISGGEPGGSTGQFQWNNGGVFAGLSNLTTDGTNVTLGGTPVLPSTITMGSNSFIRSGAHNLTLTTTGTSNITFPSGTNTVATLAGTQSFTGNKTFSGSFNYSGVTAAMFGTINNAINIGGSTESSDIGGNDFTNYKFNLTYSTPVGMVSNNWGYSSAIIGTTVAAEASGSTHPLVSSLIVRPVSITNHASGTTNLSATVYIEGESTGTASPLESYSLYIASGKTRVSDEGITFSDTGVINKVKVTIAAEDLRNCSTTPITLIPAQGVNTTIDLINIVGYIDYDSEVYNFSDNLTINQNSYEYYEIDRLIINNPVAAFFKTSYEVNGVIASFSESNVPIQLTSLSDATQGDSDVTLIITYTVNQF